MAKQRPPRWPLIRASYEAGSHRFLQLKLPALVAVVAMFASIALFDSRISAFLRTAISDWHSVPKTPVIDRLAEDFVLAVFLSPVALLIHRRIILNSAGNDNYLATLLSERSLRFIGVALALQALEDAGDAVFDALQQINGLFDLVGMAFDVFIAVLAIRLCLAFPGIAVDWPHPLASSLRTTRGSWWWLVWTGFLTIVVPSLLPFAAGLIEFDQYGPLWAVVAIARAVLAAWLYFVGIALLSKLYQTRAEWAVETEALDTQGQTALS